MQKLVFDPKKDFENLKYPVFSVESKLLDRIPELAPYAEILAEHGTGRPDIDKLMRYTMVLYDKQSRLIKYFTNLEQRKREAAILAGYDLDEDAAILTTLFDFTDPDLQAVALYFLEEQNDMCFRLLISNEQTFSEYQKALMTTIKIGDEKDKMSALNIKTKLMEESDRIVERVEKYYTKVYGEGEEKVKAKTKDFTPESIARRK